VSVAQYFKKPRRLIPCAFIRSGSRGLTAIACLLSM
jgi:hypothetical protein